MSTPLTGIMSIALTLIIGGVGLIVYTYLGYPIILYLLGSRRSRTPGLAPAVLPSISITVPVYNEEAQIRGLIESLLSLTYPPELRQILIVSDASTDRTDEIVREFADQGVELLRLDERVGKTAAEDTARHHLRGEIVVNTDASVRMEHDALMHLIPHFADPEVGVASARDISVARVGGDANRGESGYVGYEMWVRGLEDRLGGIIGASGCCYAIRSRLHRLQLPDSLSRDFAAALHAREYGFRARSVDEAICYVPRSGSLRSEYRRKVRTMTRGMQTLQFKAHLLDPVRYGAFSWMLFSHKICRWLVPWALIGVLIGVAVLAMSYPVAGWVLGGAIGLGILAGVGWYWPEGKGLPPVIALPTYLVLGNLAAVHASILALRGVRSPVWEPTRREVVAMAGSSTIPHGGG